ncbi:MAG TPA: sulfate adenylyltransferase subunit CysD [Gemmatimonadaceae bacterium]|nr:sulfate adenylyltransferase subunit CysD [Gemmatimonadaceae bacterium]
MPDAEPLSDLESESIEIFREAVAAARNPVLLYSIGKDSSVLLHLARKAFYPAKPPMPLLHVDTTWKFREMYAHRDRTARETGMQLIVHVNEEGLRAGVSPVTHGSEYHTNVMKTQALRQALDTHGFDVIFGGARRDEERSRAKERIFSFRGRGHRWEPRTQRPELWNLYNARMRPGETMRVFPLSNWTELDVWRYIGAKRIPVVPLYFSMERKVVRRGGTWIMRDDDRMPLLEGEVEELRRVRFRTLGCYPLSGAIESEARNVAEIIAETASATTSERQGRLIDSDQPGSMERKKQEGYF